jgi:hypothetical protein
MCHLQSGVTRDTGGRYQLAKKGFLAVWSGLKRLPLAWQPSATYLMAFLCSAERGRFFVPA